MLKKITGIIVSICLICIILASDVYANKVDGYFKDDNKFVVLATIIDATDTTYTISCGHVLSSPEYSTLAETITVNKFRYAYDSEQADNYNTPHIGDNIIISFKYNGYSYEILNGVYMVSTVTYSSAFVFIPKELTKKDEILGLSALAYYIRSNGECVDYIYTENTVKNKEGFEINASQYLRTIETDNATGRKEETANGFSAFLNTNKWITGTFIIIFGMILGLVALIIINKKVIR